MLDHPPLEGVARDAQQLSSLDDAARAGQRLLAQQPDAPEPQAPGVLRGAPLRFSTRALQRLGAVLAAVGMLAGALALVDGVASSRRTVRDAAAPSGSSTELSGVRASGAELDGAQTE